MSGISSDKFQELALLQGILTTYDPDSVLPQPNGVLSFTYRLVMELVRDCLTKYHQGRISSEYLEHLQKNIWTLVQQAEQRSQSGDLAFFKQLAQKVLCVLECPGHLLEHLETPDCDSKIGQELNIADPNTSQPGLKSDLIEETTELSNADETPEIPESARALIRSLNPMRKPGKHDYEQIKLINRGTFGKIQLVRDKDTNHAFAMKTLARRGLQNPKLLRLAYLERDITIFSDCPFVISMFCSFPTRHHLCMVMELAVGDCGKLIQYHRPLPLTWARTYIAETVLAVEYLHSYGVVHRDLKPENLMISSTGHIKVTDFGLAKLGIMRPTSDIYKAPTEDITREFLDDEIFGTRYYIAPEVILQKGYGRSVDWWSTGIILYQFLTGFLPFNGKSRNDVFNSILKDDIHWTFNNYTPPPDAQNIITELLRKNPTHRLGTGGANEIKMHPFLSDLDFDNLQSQPPPYVPYVETEQDNDYCKHRCERHKQNDASEVNDWPESRNFVSTSHRLSNLHTTNTRMMDNEDHQTSPGCSLETSSKHSNVQKETTSENDGDNHRFTIEKKSSSPMISVEKRRKSELKVRKEQTTELVAEGEPRRGSIFRRMISSCRRRLSRAAHTIRESCLFALCHQGSLDISKTENALHLAP